MQQASASCQECNRVEQCVTAKMYWWQRSQATAQRKYGRTCRPRRSHKRLNSEVHLHEAQRYAGRQAPHHHACEGGPSVFAPVSASPSLRQTCADRCLSQLMGILPPVVFEGKVQHLA